MFNACQDISGLGCYYCYITAAYLVKPLSFRSFFFHHLKGQSRWNGCSCRGSHGGSLLSQIRESELGAGGQYPWTRCGGGQRRSGLLVTNHSNGGRTNYSLRQEPILSRSLDKACTFQFSFPLLFLWYYSVILVQTTLDIIISRI